MTNVVDFVSTLPREGAKIWNRLTQRSSSNFKFAFFFLTPAQRDALKCVYAFCREVDDIVDERAPGPEGEAQAREGLQRWREEIAAIYGNGAPQTDLGLAIERSHREFSFPRHGFDEIIEGCAMDLEKWRYEDQDELRLYCYRVASCVGFLCIAVFGDQSETARAYAEHLGLALQYTNILRDVAEDAMRDRIYLPRSLLSRHGLSEQDILNLRYDDRFRGLGTEFAALAQDEYDKAWALLPSTQTRAMLPAEVMGRTYYEILRSIRDYDYNVFVRRVALRRRDKLRVAAEAIARAGLTLRGGEAEEPA